MAKYRIRRAVERAEGWQTWLVEGKSEADALRKYEKGKCEFEEEEVEVVELGTPEVELADDVTPAP